MRLARRWSPTPVARMTADPATTIVPALTSSFAATSTGSASPVSKDVSTSSAPDSSTTPSTGIWSPRLTLMTSPRTSASAGRLVSVPSRQVDTVGADSNLRRPSTRDARHSCSTPTAALAATTTTNVASRIGPTTTAMMASAPSNRLNRVSRLPRRICRNVREAPIPEVLTCPARCAASTCALLSPRRVEAFIRGPDGIPGRGRLARAVAAPSPAWEIQVCEPVLDHWGQ